MLTTISKEYWELISNIKGNLKRNKIPDPDKFEIFFRKLYGEVFHKNIEHVVQGRLKGESTESKEENLIFDPEISLEELKRNINKLKLNKL